jgi:hypothetical protein
MSIVNTVDQIESYWKNCWAAKSNVNTVDRTESYSLE